MARIVNLNKARKDRARAGDKSRAEVNARKFGRSKAEKAVEQHEANRTARDLDGHKREE